MAVSLRAAGNIAGNATTASQAITAPACSAGDILIAALINKSATANKISPPDSTWSEFYQGVNDCTLAADDHECALFWKRATGSGGNFTFTKATDDNVLFAGVIVAYQGCVSHGNPLDSAMPLTTTSATAAAAENVSFNAFDPVGTDVHVIFVAFYGNDLTTFDSAMVPNTNPVCATDCDVETSTGNDCSIAFASGDNDGSNIVGRTWASKSTADAGNTGVVFALSPSTAIGDYWPLASTDDASEAYDSPYANSTSNGTPVLEAATTYSRSAGVRFPALPITQYATITSAVVKVAVRNTKFDDFDLRVYAEDIDAGPVFNTTNGNIGGRTRTTAYVDWDALSTGAGWISSPSIASLIEEVVNRPGWASGNALNLLFEAQSTSPVAFDHWDIYQSYAPELTVAWVLRGTAALAGTGSGTVTGLRTARGTAALAGTGTLVASGEAVTPAITGTAALGATSTFTATGFCQRLTTSALSGAGTASALGSFLQSATSAVTGTGTLTATGSCVVTATVGLSGTGSATGTGSYLLSGLSALSGTGTLNAASQVTTQATAALTGTGTLTATPIVMGQGEGVAALTATGTLTVTARVLHFATAACTGTGTSTITGIRVTLATVAFAGLGTTLITGDRSALGTATLAGTGACVPIGLVQTLGAAALAGLGTLAASGYRFRVGAHEGVVLNVRDVALATLTLGETTPEWD